MQLRIVLLSLLALCVTLAAIPAMSQGYENGPVNGTTDAWAFSGGFQNTQSFTLTGNSFIQSFNGWFWIAPGDSITGAQLSIGTSPFGSDIFNTTLGTPTTTNCFSNQYGYNVCDEGWTFAFVPVGAGNYWLTLQNGTTAFGTQPFWDENSGIGCHSPGCPSTAMLNNGVGTIPSEAFTIGAVTSTTTSGTTPEPSSIMLFGSGILGLAGVLRRKLF